MLENEDSKIMVFEPTLEEFKDFPKYISYMESKGAHHGGIAKVIPPKEWRATRDYNMKRIGEIVIKTPVTQTITGQQGVFQLFNISNKPITVKDFKELAESHKYKMPKSDPEDLERKFWKNLTFNPPIYGADVPGTIYDEDCEYWNINNLGTILDILNKSCKIKIKGVNTAYLYFGMWKTTFPWHTEDMDLYSINYLHFGEPKSWYAIPPEHGKRLETLAKGYFSGCALDCSEFLRHKMAIISPQVLRKFSIPFNKMTQYKNEFIITFPFGYHAGYNHGFNCAESTNFASERWIDFGKKAQHCKCILDSVKIDMDVFIKNYQPNQWKEILQQRQNQNSNSSSIKSNKKPKVRNVIQSSSDSKECSSESDSTQSSEEGFDYKQEDTQLELQEIPKKRLKIHEATFKKASSKKLNQRVNKTFQSAHSNFFENTNKSKLKTTKKGVSIPLVWSHQPFAVDKEIVYNRFISSAAVRCAVCVYFSQNDSEFLHMGSVLNQTTEKKILVTELCYAKNPSKETNIEVAYDYIFSGEEASKHVILLECCECALKVHSICYGVSPENIAKNWVCDKCYFLKNENVSATNVSLANEGNNNSNESIQHNCLSQSNYNISCCLCCLRGGALKQTTEGGWCHIVCAIAFPDVTFANISARGPINVSNLDPARKKLSCMYCSPLKNPSNHMGACLQCKCRKCAISFHVTCSFHNGIPLRFGNWPTLIEVACPKHVRQKFQNVSEPKEKPNVAHGDFVVAKHKNGRYYKGKVLETTMVLYYKVVFQDKSFCFDLPPEDIKNVDAENSILLPGTNVDVLWPSDSVTYPAEVLGHHYECHCQVSFEDGSILSIKRSDLYTLNEELPMRVKKKLSYASETQNKFYLSNSLQTGTKRLRKGSRSSSTLNVDLALS